VPDEFSPLGPLRVARCLDHDPDPALDMTAAQLRAYRDSGCDPKLLTIKPGCTPIWFVLDPLPHLYVAADIEAQPGQSRKATFAAMAACHRVELADGNALEPPKSQVVPLAWGAKQVPQAFAGELIRRFGLTWFLALGNLAIDRAFARSEPAQNP